MGPQGHNSKLLCLRKAAGNTFSHIMRNRPKGVNSKLEKKVTTQLRLDKAREVTKEAKQVTPRVACALAMDTGGDSFWHVNLVHCISPYHKAAPQP